MRSAGRGGGGGGWYPNAASFLSHGVVPTPSLGESSGWGWTAHLLPVKSAAERRRNAWLADESGSLWQGQAPGVEHAGYSDSYELLVEIRATKTSARLGLMVGRPTEGTRRRSQGLVGLPATNLTAQPLPVRPQCIQPSVELEYTTVVQYQPQLDLPDLGLQDVSGPGSACKVSLSAVSRCPVTTRGTGDALSS